MEQSYSNIRIRRIKGARARKAIMTQLNLFSLSFVFSIYIKGRGNSKSQLFICHYLVLICICFKAYMHVKGAWVFLYSISFN